MAGRPAAGQAPGGREVVGRRDVLLLQDHRQGARPAEAKFLPHHTTDFAGRCKVGVMGYILGEGNFIASSINPSIQSESWPASLNNVRNETNSVGTGDILWEDLL